MISRAFWAIGSNGMMLFCKPAPGMGFFTQSQTADAENTDNAL